MDAHLQNNQTAEDDILASPDRLKGRWLTLTGFTWIYIRSRIGKVLINSWAADVSCYHHRNIKQVYHIVKLQSQHTQQL